MTDSTLTETKPPIGLLFRSLFRADFTVLVRSVRTVAINLAVPLLVLIITGLHSGQGTGAAAGLTTTGYDIALSITYGLMASSLIGYSITVARDRDAGIFQRLRVTPAPTWAIMGSRLLVQIVVDLVMTVIVLVVGSIIHHLAFTVTQYLLLACISLFGGIMFLAIGQAVVGLVRSATAVNAIGRVLYVVLILLGLLGSSGLLGDTVKAVADWTPVGAMINLYIVTLNLASWGWSDTNALIAIVIYTVVGAFIGIRWFRWDSR